MTTHMQDLSIILATHGISKADDEQSEDDSDDETA